MPETDDTNEKNRAEAEPATAPPTVEVKPAPAPRGGRVSSGLALILALAALLVSGYLWYTLIYQRPELVKIDLPHTLDDLAQSRRDLRTALDRTETKITALSETQNTLKMAVDRVQSELGRNRTQWMINETEQLLLIANRRLQLAHDTTSALAALRAADRQLELLASPKLLPVRREIAEEITMLESVDRTDVAGITLRLGSIADGVDQLPLGPDLRAPTAQVATADNETGSKRSMWHDLLGLVRIRRHDTSARPLLPPEQSYFARQNLRLMLYGAQHALLQGNIATYRQNLNTAARWLGEYFDTGSTAVASVREELEKMQAAPATTPLPDITASLDMLRKATDRQLEP